jgi:hypothetical protein
MRGFGEEDERRKNMFLMPCRHAEDGLSLTHPKGKRIMSTRFAISASERGKAYEKDASVSAVRIVSDGFLPFGPWTGCGTGYGEGVQR